MIGLFPLALPKISSQKNAVYHQFYFHNFVLLTFKVFVGKFSSALVVILLIITSSEKVSVRSPMFISMSWLYWMHFVSREHLKVIRRCVEFSDEAARVLL